MSGEVLITFAYQEDDHSESSVIIKRCNKNEYINIIESLLTEILIKGVR